MKIALQFQGKEKIVESQWIRGQLWYHLDGETRVWEPASSRTRAGKAKNDQIISPMPGKVTKVLRSVGEQVRVGDVVLVLEAMKMEYSMKAEVDGMIEDISVIAGEQTVLGKILVKIKTLPKDPVA